jgi:hypothetical protein
VRKFLAYSLLCLGLGLGLKGLPAEAVTTNYTANHAVCINSTIIAGTAAPVKVVDCGGDLQGSSIGTTNTNHYELTINVNSNAIITGNSKTFTVSDLFKVTNRSNSGGAMTETFPADSTLVAGQWIIYVNLDATADATITAGAGSTIEGSATDVVEAGKGVFYYYDKPATRWRKAINTASMGIFAQISSNVVDDIVTMRTTRTGIKDSGVAIGAGNGNVCTNNGSCTETNKTINGASNTLSNIACGSLKIANGLQDDGSGNCETTSGIFGENAAATNPTTLTNANCGQGYVGAASNSTYTLPASPPTNCTFKFTVGPAGFYIGTNGKTAKLPCVGYDVTQFTITGGTSGGVYRTNNAAHTIVYNGTYWEYDKSSSPVAEINQRACNASPLTHGQGAFAYDSGGAQFTYTPRNGSGISVDAEMWALTSEGLTLPASATTNSATNYFYATKLAADSGLVVTGVAANAGHPQLTFSASLNAPVGAIVKLRCVNIGGAIQANVNDAAIVDGTGTTATFRNTTSSGMGTYTSGGQCDILHLTVSTTGPSFDVNAIYTLSGDSHESYVGQAVIGGAHAVTSWTGYFNSAEGLTNGVTGAGAVVLATSPSISGPTISGIQTNTGHVVSNGTALGCGDLAFGTGAGTSPTCTSVTGDDRRYRVSFSTGTAPATGAVIFTVTFKSAYGATPFCALTPETSTGAAKINALFLTPTTTTLALALSTIGVLVASTAYVFTFQCIG